MCLSEDVEVEQTEFEFLERKAWTFGALFPPMSSTGARSMAAKIRRRPAAVHFNIQCKGHLPAYFEKAQSVS